MRRSASALFLSIALAGSWWLAAGSYADDCRYDPGRGEVICSASGGSTNRSDTTPPRERPPMRYIYEATDATGAPCYYWSPTPGGLDVWDPGNDPAVAAIVLTTPVCPVIVETPEDTAWRIFRSFALALPDPSLEPAAAGITGLPTYLATPGPPDITHVELLPDGRSMEVWAAARTLVIDWGDGTNGSFDAATALTYPSGAVTHTYATKTCNPTYRSEHPYGGNCHPTLEAYPITATFVWEGRYRIGGGWIYLGTLDRTATVLYDVDEVQGVLLR
ncbi:MAG: hypothetical protein WBN93_06250 [Acidimicrobiia bacterium]